MKKPSQVIDPLIEKTGMPREVVLHLLASEAFIRRAALVSGPFMLKGSYVTRQYLSEEKRAARIPADLDWVGLDPLDRATLDRWTRAITLTRVDDGIEFRDFKENCFWRMIDYAMDDDFPTVNTDLLLFIEGEKLEIGMDVSFNLALTPPPIPLTYQALQEDSFFLPFTCPLELQIAWKLHQCLIRPRLKDLLDLSWLLPHNPFDTQACWDALRAECKTDKANLDDLRYLLGGNLPEHPCFKKNKFLTYQTLASAWDQNKSYWGSHADRALPNSQVLLKDIDQALRQSPLMPWIESQAARGFGSKWFK